MKNSKKLVLFLSILLFAILVLPNSTFAVTEYTGEVKDYNSNELIYGISITSDGLAEGLMFTPYQGYSYFDVEGENKVFSESSYKYDLRDPANGSNLVNSLNNKTATIRIYKEGLVEGEKFDVYHLTEHTEINSEFGYPMITYSINENLDDIEAEVVKISGKLYIQFTTTSLESFILNPHTTENYKSKLAQITDNGIYIVDAANPKDYEMFDAWSYFITLNKKELGYQLELLEVYPDGSLWMTIKFDDLPNEKHLVKGKYKYNTLDPKIKSIIDGIADKCYDENVPFPYKFFTIEDLSYINFLNSDSDVDDMVYYSNDLKEVFNGINFVPYFDYRAGDGSPFNNEAVGFMTVSYNGTLYPLGIDGGYRLKQVIYVPSDTQNTDVALIAAAKSRIAEYLGVDENKIVINVAGTRQSLNEEGWDVWANYDVDNISDNYFDLTINGKKVQIVIERNSEKAKELEFKTCDLLTDIQITSTSGTIPMDTILAVKKIATGAEYDKIIKILNATNNEMFDLSLYSNSLDKYISKLEDGSFEVRIPIPDKFKDKELVIYYVDENSKVIDYPVKIKEDFAVFYTDHFSIYTLAEKLETPPVQENIETQEKDETPKTGSFEYSVFAIFIIMISALGISILKLRKN